MTRRTAFRATATRRVRRAGAVLALGAAATVGLSACQWTSPITTQLQYDASDGVSATVSGVRVLNALVVAAQADGPGTLQASFYNTTSEKKSLQVRVGSATVGTVDVDPGQTVAVGAAGKPMTIPTVPAAPGALMDLVMGTSNADAAQVRVPVLAPQGPYATLTPTASPTASSSSTATTQATATAPATAGTGASSGTASAGATATGSATATTSPAATATATP